MQTVKTSDILAVAARLAPETCRVGAVLHRKLALGEDHVAVEIGHRHLGRGYEIEIVLAYVIHLTLLVGELSGAVARSLVDHVGGLNLKITGFGSLIEEKLYQSALQFGALPFVDRETGAGDLHS